MDCKNVEELISALIENELDEHLQRQIEQHIEQCQKCARVKETIENILNRLPDLSEDVPFFLENRLYNIPERIETRPTRALILPKWIAATVGTIVLFLNLFYFTNIYPAANRQLHTLVSSIERFISRADGWLETIKESKDLFFSTIFSKTPSESKNELKKKRIP